MNNPEAPFETDVVPTVIEFSTDEPPKKTYILAVLNETELAELRPIVEWLEDMGDGGYWVPAPRIVPDEEFRQYMGIILKRTTGRWLDSLAPTVQEIARRTSYIDGDLPYGEHYLGGPNPSIDKFLPKDTTNEP